MSDQLFEVAFSGKISAGANPEEVRVRLGKMFNADEAKLTQLFSGKRIVIKKNVDRATASKYQSALTRAGAECEIVQIGGSAEAAPAATETPAVETAAATQPAAGVEAPAPVSQEYESSYDGEVAPPPQTDPLGITGDQIEELAISIAPVGSELQDDYQQPEAPAIDITGFDIAPVGSDLGSPRKEADPPPPDITGITLAD